MTTPTQPSTEPAATPLHDRGAGSSDGLTHIVGWWQSLLGDTLRIKVPRGLCGVSLAGVDEPDTTPSPCERCAELNGGRPTKAVPPHKALHFGSTAGGAQ